jgi:hypothetical protein
MSVTQELYDKIVKPAKTEYERQVKELRETCPHLELSEWMDEWWAIAHSTGFRVQTCERCGKEMHRKTVCHRCEREIMDSGIMKGDGSNKFPLGGTYCPTCFASGSRINTPSETDK